MRLLLDVMCGGIAAQLRMCGHDTVYALDRDLEADDEVLELSRSDDRTLVTRDRDLSRRADRSILLESTDPVEQLRELAAAGVSLEIADQPQRCGQCNGSLRRVDDGTMTPEYAPDPTEEPLWQCRRCGQFFWKGSHWDRVAETLDSL